MKNIAISSVILTIFLSCVLLNSCQKDIDVGATSAVKVANQWWCHFLDEDGNEIVGYFPFTTYNTSANKDSMWIDDNQNVVAFKVKVKFNSDGTFETTKSMNEYYDPTDDNPDAYPEYVVVSDGKVMTNAAKSKTGVVVDSIYMKVSFSDDPGATYIIAGLAKTGWDDDDY
ncbi:MAG TPA: lipid-binding protein [Candidatus Babeliaceae bacterium]|jgi:hypothetical protein|nr:lipid-binding protein [Candidatus Babeliaceae bacterium]